ncbi:hypothetical protein AAJ72_01985 [Citromicrobium sp. RCC1885]|uniref:serine hydrolase domain-containing protein n=1 Tax=unclassified Citromicrobium TaxID=2630544 RepID=UPI0006C9000A|nr:MULTISPECIES: serine hydrolase domain-containing protein [unclassified Citromicrobium]KPM24550.1 hypothetical protein AAJ72_01985 [Citromicrobium sp. RCC1885]KPM27792.1 hypothetical protein AAJ74_02730 [Citromicrobium sp. RCC1878]MAO05148.1 hypothetical protein [Citromicrobium sp.]|tara:strand:- start:2730 stop:3677 length:948 start_codon:yes stop_codon:yes gene_type:complete
MKYSLAAALLAIVTASPAFSADYAEATLTPDGQILSQTHGEQDAAALYEAGSIGKFACTIATLRLADRDMVSLDATLGRLLPQFADTPIAPISLRQLLASRSGLADGLMPAFRSDPQSVMSTPDAPTAIARFASGPLAFDPDTQWSYDLVNWIAVQAVLEKVSGLPIAELLAREVLQPAGMGDSRVFLGRVGEGGAVPASEAPPLPGFLTCAGGLGTTPRDLLALARFPHMGGVSAASLAELTTVHTPEEGYTLGGRFMYRDDSAGGQPLSWQSGSNGAYKSLVTYDPASDTGFAAMTASGDNTEIEAARDAWMD